MSPVPYHVVAFTISSLVVLLSTPVVRAVGLSLGRVDVPDQRKVHRRPMVRLGGIAIILGSLTSLLVVWSLGGFRVLPPKQEYEVWGVVLGSIAFFSIGLADDFFNLSAWKRLLLQGTVATLAWQAGVRIEFLSIPGLGLVPLLDWLSLIVTSLWLVGMTNAINWIDGLDGLAAGVSGIAAVAMLMVCLFMNHPDAALLAAALAGATLGFLRYNFNPAQIFMGDGGSYFLGFTLAGVGIIGLVKSVTAVAVVLPYLILAVPLLDMTAVIVGRLRRGQSPFVADDRHLHHRLLRAGLSHRLTVLFIYALTFWVGSLALAFAGLPSGIVYACGATALLVYTVWKVRRSASSCSKRLF